MVLEDKALERNEVKYHLLYDTQGMKQIKACISMWVADELNNLCWRLSDIFKILLFIKCPPACQFFGIMNCSQDF